MDRYDRSLLSQLRYGILPLEIETGRYKNVARDHRICTLCNTAVEDQIHFVFKCPTYENIRNDFYVTCEDRVTNWAELSDTQRIAILFENHPRMFGKYVKKLFVHRKNILFN